MTFSIPFCSWESTAPTPLLEASVSRINIPSPLLEASVSRINNPSLFELESIGELVRACMSLSKASGSSHPNKLLF